jgi:DNA-binding transcriptional MerR regulator
VELTQEEFLHRLRITPEELDAWLEHELVAPLSNGEDGRPSALRFAESAVEEGELIRKFSALGYSLPEIQKIKRSVGLPVRDEQGRFVSRSDLLTIGELAERSGINVRTIKFWEEKGLISPHRRTEGGFRLYKPGDVVVLSFIKDLQSFNYTLAEIGTILGLAGPDLGATDADLAGRPPGELEKTAAALEYLIERMREMREASVRVETIFTRRLRAVTKAIRSRKH